MHRSFMLIAYYNLHLPEQIEERGFTSVCNNPQDQAKLELEFLIRICFVKEILWPQSIGPFLLSCHQSILYLDKKIDVLSLVDTTCARGVHPLLKVLDFVPMLGIDYRSQDLKQCYINWHASRHIRKDKWGWMRDNSVRKLTSYVTWHDMLLSTSWHAVWHEHGVVWCHALCCGELRHWCDRASSIVWRTWHGALCGMLYGAAFCNRKIEDLNSVWGVF